MGNDEVKKKIKETLSRLGASEIKFQELENDGDKIAALFNWRNVLNFKVDLPGWVYTGIQLDATQDRQYKVEFFKQK